MTPQRLRRPCAHPGCAALVRPPARYCPKHQADATAYDRQRGTANERGYTSRWAKYRKWYLSQPEHVLYTRCLAEDPPRVTPATQVDHNKAVTGPDDPLFWEPSNHQALRDSCHSRKTATEDRGFGNQSRR